MICESEFRPAWWLNNGHLQTIWGSLFRQSSRQKTIHQRFELDDGDFLDLEWSAQKKNSGTPILLILHGLEGSVQSSYIQGLLQATQSHQWNTVVMHFRGCGRDKNRLPRSYHSGETADLTNVLQWLKVQHPDSKIMTVGFSLGGNVLLKYLGESQKQSQIDIAAAISVPFLLSPCSKRLDKGFSRFYRNRLLKELKIKTSDKLNQFSTDLLPSQSVLENIKTLFEFDDQVTARLNGFENGDDYYQRSSSRQFLASIATPTLILHAVDDPFMTKDVIPTEKELSAFVQLELSQTGGHVGFVSGKYPWRASYYVDQRIPAWFSQQLKRLIVANE